FAYDSVGNLKSRVLQSGIGGSAIQRTEYDYDALNRQIQQRQYSLATSLIVVTALAYDAAGNLTSTSVGANTTDPARQTTRYEYDKRNRRLRTINALGGSSSVAYDANGNVVTEIDPNNNKTTHEYDHLNREIRTVLPDPAFAGESQPVKR